MCKLACRVRKISKSGDKKNTNCRDISITCYFILNLINKNHQVTPNELF